MSHISLVVMLVAAPSICAHITHCMGRGFWLGVLTHCFLFAPWVCSLCWGAHMPSYGGFQHLWCNAGVAVAAVPGRARVCLSHMYILPSTPLSPSPQARGRLWRGQASHWPVPHPVPISDLCPAPCHTPWLSPSPRLAPGTSGEANNSRDGGELATTLANKHSFGAWGSLMAPRKCHWGWTLASQGSQPVGTPIYPCSLLEISGTTGEEEMAMVLLWE